MKTEIKTYEERTNQVRQDIAELVRVICEGEEADRFLFELLMKRHYDGLNGREWDASEHLRYEREVARLIACYDERE